MNLRAAAEKIQIKIGADHITIEPVEGDKRLLRICINNGFKGYLIRRDLEYSLSEGSDIHPLIFARIVHCLRTERCI